MADGTLVAERFVGERIGGRFVVERLSSTGALSSTFRARDELLRRRVTVKLFHPNGADDARVVEAQLELAGAVARLSHPGITVVIDRGEHDGLPFLVLEHVRGESLQERIDRFAPLPIGEVAALGAGIAGALAYAHDQGVVHGNVRPSSVLVSEDREVKLVDFGRGPVGAGSVRDVHVPPEEVEAAGTSAPAPSGDVYALAALLFVALTDARPAPGTDAARVQMLRPDASPRLAGAIARALSTEPGRRPTSMRAFAAELAPLVGVDGRSASTTSFDQPTGAMPSSARAAAAGGTTAPVSALDDLDALHPPSAGRARERRDDQRERDRRAASERRAKPRGSERRRRGRRHDERERGHTDEVAVADDPAATGLHVPAFIHARRNRRARLLVWATVLVPLVVLVVLVAMLGGEKSGDQQVSRTTTTETTATERSVEPEVTRIATFDPPPGDGSENEDAVEALLDDDPTSSWSTEGYGSANLGGLKPGVGVVVTLRQPAQLRSVTFTTDVRGWQVQVYAAETPQTSLDGWTALGDPTTVRSTVPIGVDTEGKAWQSYLLWIPQLGQDETGRYRARASDLVLKVLADQ